MSSDTKPQAASPEPQPPLDPPTLVLNPKPYGRGCWARIHKAGFWVLDYGQVMLINEFGSWHWGSWALVCAFRPVSQIMFVFDAFASKLVLQGWRLAPQARFDFVPRAPGGSRLGLRVKNR